MRTTAITFTLVLAGIAGYAVTTPDRSSAEHTLPSSPRPLDCQAIADSTEDPDPPAELAIFVDAIESAPESVIHSAEPPMTVLIPTNAAFEEMPENVLDAMFADPDLLGAVLDYHLVPGESLTVTELAEAGEVTTAEGSTLEFELDGDVLTVNGGEAAVLCADINHGDAILHVIDGVLKPPTSAHDNGGSSVPGASTPGSTAPGLGPDEQAVATAFETAVDSSLSYAEQAPHIEDAEALRDTIENYPVAADVVLGISAEVASVEIEGDAAAITYVLYFNGVDAGYGELDGTMVRHNGTWIVPRDEYCAFQAQARNNCPT